MLGECHQNPTTYIAHTHAHKLTKVSLYLDYTVNVRVQENWHVNNCTRETPSTQHQRATSTAGLLLRRGCARCIAISWPRRNCPGADFQHVACVNPNPRLTQLDDRLLDYVQTYWKSAKTRLADEQSASCRKRFHAENIEGATNSKDSGMR